MATTEYPYLCKVEARRLIQIYPSPQFMAKHLLDAPKCFTVHAVLGLERSSLHLISELDLRPINIEGTRLDGERHFNWGLGRHVPLNSALTELWAAEDEETQPDYSTLNAGKLADWVRGKFDHLYSLYKIIGKIIQHLRRTITRSMVLEQQQLQSNVYFEQSPIPEEDILQASNLRDGRSDPAIIDSTTSKAKIVHALWVSKWFNMVMTILHGSLISALVSLNFKSRSSVLVEELQSGINGMSLIQAYDENQATSLQRTSQVHSLHYFFVLVTLLDMINILYWFYHMNRCAEIIAGGRRLLCSRKLSWLRTAVSILFNPRHLYKVVYTSLLIYPGPYGWLGFLAYIFTICNQMIWHAYNFYRVEEYLKIGELTDESRLRLRRLRQPKGLCYCNWSDNKHSGWSRWPIDLTNCGCNLNGFWQHWLERLLMISQILSVKLILLNLLLQIDEKKMALSPYLVVCLLMSILSIYSYYNKYHLRYAKEEQPVEE